ncbi:stalk domain-containing protein [Acetivibrio cellulolyticus]|uniref:stalk domain-containing protein n=1 Tax=Acetivibrio cellulolyticus TaxID=35830 RepID=UPI0001E2DDFD|nr:stalk domain-containing protein [Acetivibrio cellulolyticus]
MKRINIVLSLIFALLFTCNANLQCVSADTSSKKYDNSFLKIEGNYALKSDGSIWKYSPFNVEQNKKLAYGFIDIDSAGNGSELKAIKADGSLWVWSENDSAQVAESNVIDNTAPIKIMENVKAVSGLAALKKDGSVWVWNRNGFLGSDPKTNAPVMIYKGAKGISETFDYINIIDNNGVLYAVPSINSDLYSSMKAKKIKISDNVEFVSSDYFIKKDKTLWQIQYNDCANFDLKLVLKNVKYVDSDILSNCAIKEDGTLWVWGLDDDNIPYIIKGREDNPQKIMSSVKYASCGYQSVIALKNDGSMCGFGAICPKTNYSIPQNAAKNVKTVFDNGWILTEDNSLWLLEYYIGRIEKTKISDNVKSVTEDEVIEKIDGTKWKYIVNDANDHILQQLPNDYKQLNANFQLKNDETLWLDNTVIEGEKKNYKQFDDNINASKTYLSNDLICYIKNDSSLWISLNGQRDLYSSEATKQLSKPVKLANEIKEFKACDPYIYAISNNGELLVWRINVSEDSKISLTPKLIMDNVDSFDNKVTLPMGIIKKDNSHWSGLGIDEFVMPDDIKDNYAEVLAKSLLKDIDNMEDIFMYNENLYIKKNGELWVKAGSVVQDNNTNKNSYVKVLDNVKYAETNLQKGIAICNDGSLWHFTISDSPENRISEPVKLLEKVKAAHYEPVNKVYTALQEDNSFYVWGNNSLGKCGIDSEETEILKPHKLLDDVIWSDIGYCNVRALKKDGTLMTFGFTAPDGHNPEYLINPLNSGNLGKDTKIQHRNYESVGVNEEINLIVKITDLAYTSDVKVILSNGKEIAMDKSSECYYVATIPGSDKTGVLSYHISASDNNGKVIVSDEYKVEIVTNDIVLYDSMNDEVFEADISINVDGKELYSDIKPVVKSGRTLIPVRVLCEALNAEVSWDDKSKTVTIVKENKNISLKIGENVILVDSAKKNIDVPAVIVNGRTMLPVRTVCEILGAKVTWDETAKKIDVVSH